MRSLYANKPGKGQFMNLILVFPEDFVSKTVVHLTDYRATHIREVHRAEPGKRLRVGLCGGGIGDGTVVSIGAEGVDLEVRLPETRPEPAPFSLILALPRPQTLKKVLETVGAFGIRRLSLVSSQRVQKSFFDSRLLQDKAWKRHVYLGMEQGGRTFVPEISVDPSLARLMETVDSRSPDVVRLIAHPGGPESLWQTPLAQAPQSEVVCAIGPEGGWLNPEVKEFEERGFLKIRLGETIHRVENAVTALLAQLELLRMSPLRI
jgi:16S rRNA (uracil1498-N3)-methyltransferase